MAEDFKQDQHFFCLLRHTALSTSVNYRETLSFELEILQQLRTDCNVKHQPDWRCRARQVATQNVLKREPHLDQQNSRIGQVELRG